METKLGLSFQLQVRNKSELLQKHIHTMQIYCDLLRFIVTLAEGYIPARKQSCVNEE